MADNKKPRVPHPNDPVMPADYNPDHDKEYPHESTDITGEKEQHLVEEETYETDMRDEEGRPVWNNPAAVNPVGLTTSSTPAWRFW